MTLPETFNDIYTNRSWGHDGNTRSGAGSTRPATERVNRFIGDVICSYGIKTISDISGDFAWQEVFLRGAPHVQYVGYDVAKTAVNVARDRGKLPNASFVQRDLCAEPIEECDLFIVRDVMGHLPSDLASKLVKINAPRCKYMMLTDFKGWVNEEIDAGQWYPINVLASPFDLGLTEIERMREQPQSELEIERSKDLVLFRAGA